MQLIAIFFALTATAATRTSAAPMPYFVERKGFPQQDITDVLYEGPQDGDVVRRFAAYVPGITVELEGGRRSSADDNFMKAIEECSIQCDLLQKEEGIDVTECEKACHIRLNDGIVTVEPATVAAPQARRAAGDDDDEFPTVGAAPMNYNGLTYGDDTNGDGRRSASPDDADDSNIGYDGL